MIRFALLGAGRIGQMHAANIAGHERCNLSWIYDVHTPSSEALCTKTGAKVARDQMKFLTMLKLMLFL